VTGTETDFAFFRALPEIGEGDLDALIEISTIETVPGTLFRDAMMAKGLLAYLDWKEGFEEISGHYDNQMGRLGLPVLNDAVRNAMQAREKAASGEDRLFFTDFIVELDQDAQTKSHRVLCFDERADSYAFLVVTPAQFDRWQGVSLDSTNEFYTPEAFVTDQTR